MRSTGKPTQSVVLKTLTDGERTPYDIPDSIGSVRLGPSGKTHTAGTRTVRMNTR